MLEDAFSKTIPGASLIAEDREGNTIGGIFAEKKITWMPRCAYIVSFFVSDKWRGKGVGRRLIEECVSALKKKGIRNITVNVSPTNKKAIGVYEKYGFKLFGLAYLKKI
jgi:putative acetyltransferase